MKEDQKQPSNTNTASTEPASPPQKVEEKVIFTWKAPVRLFKRRTKEFWTKIGVVGALFGVILYLAEGVMPVILLISLFFLFYVLSTIEPESVDYKITNLGVYLHKDRIDYPNVVRFWFSKERGKSILNFDLFVFPGSINVLINEGDESKIRTALQKHVPEEVPQFSRTDQLTNWVSKKLQ